MEDIWAGDFTTRSTADARAQEMRVVNWNVDRGLRFEAIADFLASQRADLILLQEVDIAARRTRCRNIAEELAMRLRMNYVFGREFDELSQQRGNGRAFHGQATLSRYPQANARLIRFGRQSNFWRPRWFMPRLEPFQVRLGGRIALITDVEIPEGETVKVYNVHLESRGNDKLRLAQLQEAVRDASKHAPWDALVLAGDFNFDVLHHKSAATLAERAGLRNAMGASNANTTAGGFLKRKRRIDWAFVSGPIRASDVRVHLEVQASDHYPISFSIHCMRNNSD
ncbi:MAG: endonuclease/exonuclease/phosphatase family protein [Acidobacteriaceae bacterium]|nr:endonuclease/exonuclease/phosphatase family protein [Acidobacteriaceae bacterium]MBV9765378.1 endonuclease/exonuclease/phosphatase family protein [Acidobacteriaceae bacterium]